MNNNFYFTLPISDKTINIPIEINWDFVGRTDDIEKWQSDVLTEILGIGVDFEVARYAHSEYSPTDTRTSLNYEFYFYSGQPVNLTASTLNSIDWVNSYLPEGFETSEIYFYRKPFTKSFFKLDFYSSSDEKNQTIYFTIIIPTQQGEFELGLISQSLREVLIRKPKYKLDFIGDKEGFFVYWLTDRSYIDLDTFYMSTKFFDAKIGVFVKMMNRPQSIFPAPNRYNFSGSTYYYNKVILDFSNYTFKVYDGVNNQRIGTLTNPIKWYEYVNPILIQ